jgi:tRNA threonylcarbamoyl adenosine modification protein YeaZ
MKILALEFSSPQRSVAIVCAEANNANFIANEVVETVARGANALGMIENVLLDARLEREAIECLAVGLGPGSYTGIRTAIALAQGWQLARDVKLLGISSAECIAAQAPAQAFVGTVSVVIDAQRDEFYLARYEISPGDCREIEPLRLASLADIEERERAGEVLIGPEVARWFSSGKIIFPRAATLGGLAIGRTDFVAGEKIEPIYLREAAFVKAPPARNISA